MKNVFYINTEDELKEYAEKSGNNIDYLLEHANRGKEYYSQFKEIEGCDVLYSVEGASWDDVYMCIRWKGVCMRIEHYWADEAKTHAFNLCEKMDWQGISGSDRISKGNEPQKIGKPTVKKLDDWRTYLLDYRRREIEMREFRFAAMVAKMEEVKKYFPEAKSVKWNHGYWSFEKVSNGLEYLVQINDNGNIYEKLNFTSYQQRYNMGETEKAAKMMQNGLNEVKPISEDCLDPYSVVSNTCTAYIKQFIGGRPF